jgi:sarcosine/dimethylglycine N-methyltransferase
MLLAELGVEVTAVDASKEMLKRTRANARVRGLKIKTLEASFEDLHKSVTGKFDAVFVLGNSLPHLRRVEDLSRVLENFSAMLEPNGLLFTQTLNYDRIMVTRDRVQNTKEAGDQTFVRFYDYDEEGILFNILTRTKLKSRIEEKLKTIRLRPIFRNEFVELMLRSGLVDVKTFGAISMEPFDPMVSKDLVILARKPQ